MKNISEDFIRTFHDKINWCDLLESNKFEVSDELLVEYKDFIDTEQFLKNYNWNTTISEREQYVYDRLNKIINLDKINLDNKK